MWLSHGKEIIIWVVIFVIVDTAVEKGIANGTLGKVRNVKLLPGVVPQQHSYDGYSVNFVDASGVDYVECEHEEPEKWRTPTFHVKSIYPRYNVHFPSQSLGYIFGSQAK